VYGHHTMSPRGPVRVLAADDSVANLMVLATFLKHNAIDLLVAEGGAEAVEAFKAQRPDLVFMDLSMPGIDGFAAAAEMRAHETASGQPRTPIIALTAFAVDAELQARLSVSMDGRLCKPVRKFDLLRAVTTWIPHWTGAVNPRA
jgi:CheY-like chemotaxis protein